jgi:hypothetical protein
MTIATLRAAALATLAASSAGIAYAAEPDPAAEDRVTRSAEGFVRERAADELRDRRALEERRVPLSDLATKPRVRAHSAAGALVVGDSWIYEAFTDTFFDFDGDGYYHYLRVRFDVDTSHQSRYVYAMIFISADGNSWEEIYSTDDFLVRGTDPDDDYEVETELVSGYSSGLYDVLIEIYDADTGVLVDEFGPNESSDFSLLALEDSVRDGIEPPPPPAPPPPPPVIVDGGSGAVSWLMLAVLALAAAVRARRRMA